MCYFTLRFIIVWSNAVVDNLVINQCFAMIGEINFLLHLAIDSKVIVGTILSLAVGLLFHVFFLNFRLITELQPLRDPTFLILIFSISISLRRKENVINKLIFLCKVNLRPGGLSRCLTFLTFVDFLLRTMLIAHVRFLMLRLILVKYLINHLLFYLVPL